MSSSTTTTHPHSARWGVRLFWFTYVVLLVASLGYEFVKGAASALPGMDQVEGLLRIPAFSERSGGESRQIKLAYSAWPTFGPGTGTPTMKDTGRPPVILIHGSPGEGQELGKIGTALEKAGYQVLAPDLPGFGDSTHNPPSLSILAHAHEVLALLDQLHIQKAHILGWSLGGGVAMHIVDLAPDRVASLTLMASISDQESEGTRSYFAEHAKYALGYAAATAARYAIPHFGSLAEFDNIRASMINFWDTDLRPLQDLMRRIKTPTLILHGTNDPLVPRWAAEHSHELIEPSTLVMTPYSHFFPFMQPDYAAAVILPFITRHDTPTPALRQLINLAPERPSLLGAFGDWAALQFRQAHWLTLLIAATAVLLYRRRTAAILLFLAVYFSLIDNGIAFGAIFAAQLIAAIVALIRGRSGGATARRRNSDFSEHHKPGAAVPTRPATPTPPHCCASSQDYEGDTISTASSGTIRPHPRVIGTGISTRAESHWQQLLTERPILLTLASRFVPNEQETTIQAAASVGSVPLHARLAFLVATLFSWPLWTLFYLITTILAAMFIVQPLTDRARLAGLLLGIAISIPLIRSLELLLTTTGRRLLRIRFTRLTRREYWPSHLLYYPTAPYFIYLGLKHAPIAFTACNPGIEHGGGLIGESKQSILDAMPDAAPWILQSVRIGRGDPGQRTAQAIEAMKNVPNLTYPVILKPDSGYRGHAVRLARSDSDIRNYFQSMLAPAILQQYHPGPRECGILWARNPKSPQGPGFIFSVTRKEFPILTGDGRHTFEQLIFRHKRFHAQAGVFLSRHADKRTWILAAGETFRLAESGNHCQGTLFLDGEDLITPELSAAIDSIAQGFRGGLDIGRFDIRYESDELLRQGKSFAILELNGITGESTNIYDPSKSIWWAYKTHFRQWRLMYELGMTRMATGHKPMSVKEVFKRISTHKRSRSGSALAD